ncbi:MAG: hypothetical protein IPK83_25120 [Planctomycetes bacterium]|nr:hypothetical protein [Planctomycetota bacterium]
MVEMLNNGAGFGGWNRRKQLSGMAVGLAIFAAGTARADINSVLDKITDRATQARDKAAAKGRHRRDSSTYERRGQEPDRRGPGHPR